MRSQLITGDSTSVTLNYAIMTNDLPSVAQTARFDLARSAY